MTFRLKFMCEVNWKSGKYYSASKWLPLRSMTVVIFKKDLERGQILVLKWTYVYFELSKSQKNFEEKLVELER